MGRSDWNVSSRPPGKLNLSLTIAQTHERQRKVMLSFPVIRRVFPLIITCLVALGLLLLLSGFSDIRLTDDWEVAALESHL